MPDTTRSVLLVRRGGVDLVADGSDLPILLGGATMAFTELASRRLIAQRLLDHCTVLSECLAARHRMGMPADLQIDELLSGSVPHAEAALQRCVESVSARPFAHVVQEEVIASVGLAATAWEPEPVSTAGDLGSLLEVLDQERAAAPAHTAAGTVRIDGEAAHGPLVALRTAALDLTVVAGVAHLRARAANGLEPAGNFSRPAVVSRIP
jgi:hypothetical protein